MDLRRAGLIAIAAALLSSCAGRPVQGGKLTVAAAANLMSVFGDVGRAYEARTNAEVVFSYGSTAQLAQEIENGAPFDLFAAADTEHVDALVASGKLAADSRAVYALGRLALWIPQGEKQGIRELKDLAGEQVRYIAIARPELAPYGQAAAEALKRSGLWETVQSKIVYGNSVNMAKQMASSGNADAAFTAYSLVLHEQGSIVKVDPGLYDPIEQALAIVTSSPRIEQARQFRAFLLSAEGRAILAKAGYLAPPSGS
jgi:molybdate transport system substrate-binding protein